MIESTRRLRLPAREALIGLCDQVAPGSRPMRLKRLRGGLEAAMHAVDLEEPSGRRLGLVLRRYNPDLLEGRPDLPVRLWRTLGALEQLQLDAPRPVWFDGDGALFGVPALAMTRMPGHGLLRPANLHDWTGRLARGLAAIHRARVSAVDLSFLPQPGHSLDAAFEKMAKRRGELEAQPQGAALLAALEHWRARLRPAAPLLCHGDYWSGNTLWLRGRLTGVVDWDDARVDHPGVDVGYCRMDLNLLIGPEAPDLFLDAYEAAAGRRVPQLFFWDLLGALQALPDPAGWLPGLHDLGRTEMTPELMRGRLQAFIAGALARAS